jgi:hypothetical protein
VNHLISEANKAVQTERHRAVQLDVKGPPKARRLRELESNPPGWLKAAIGRPPGMHRSAEARLCWRRAALAIDEYRSEHGAHLNDEPRGTRPSGPWAARAYDLADRAITRAREVFRPSRLDLWTRDCLDRMALAVYSPLCVALAANSAIALAGR